MSDENPRTTGGALGSRRVLIGAVVALAVVVVVLVIVLATGGGGGKASKQAQRSGGTLTSSQSGTPAANAQEIASIKQTALAYQKALSPRSTDNPCRYMTAVAQSGVMSTANPAVSAKGCAAAVRAEQNSQNVPLWQARPLGVNRVVFAPNVPIAGLQGTAPGAQAYWSASGYAPISLVHRGSTWLIATS